MATTKADLRAMVRRRLNDDAQSYWGDTEIDQYILAGYRLWARLTRAIWDWYYAENIPQGMSYTAPFEAELVEFDYGQANFTAEFERRLFLDDEADAVGPGNYTSPFEATEGYLERGGMSTAIPATVELPATVTEIDRPMWDQCAIPVISPRDAERRDSRYELTEGEVYALVTTGQGVRTVRKVRVPAEISDTYTVEGSWGVLRDATDATTGTADDTDTLPRTFGVTCPWEIAIAANRGYPCGRATYTASFEEDAADALDPVNATGPANSTTRDDYAAGTDAGFTMTTTTGVFGVPRQIPGHHVIGDSLVGLPRRLYRDGKNVRIEHWREGRSIVDPDVALEMPDRAAVGLREYVLSRCYAKYGPAQDQRLAQHYEQRWTRSVARWATRVQAQQRGRVSRMGGAAPVQRNGPPRPQLPWQYGVVVR